MHFAVRRALRACTTVLALPVLFACSGDGSGPIITPPTQSISIAVAPATLELNQGANGNVTVTLTRNGGYTGAVTVAVEGLPAGVTIPGITIASGSNSGTLNVAAAAAAAAATTGLTVRATGTGVSAATASLSVTVKAVSNPVPAFAIGLSSGTASIAAGGNGTATVNVTRSGGFTGAVALSATVAPAGPTVSFNPASVTGASSTMTVNVGAGVAAGNYVVTVRGASAGLTDQTAPFTVTVTTQGGGGGGSANWVFCGSSGLPVWFAFQDGTSAWTRVTGTNNAYSFTINGARGGVAYVVPTTAGGFDLEVFYGTKAEIEAQGAALCAGATGPGVTVNGTISGGAAGDLILIAMAKSIGIVAQSGTTFSIPGVPAGSFDLIAGKSSFALVGGGVSFTPNRFFIGRGISSASSPNVDFNGANSFAPATATVTTNNLGGDIMGLLMAYFTANSLGSLYVDAVPSAGGTRTFYGVPGARQQNGDWHFMNVIALPSLQNTTQTRQAGIAFKDIGNKTVTLGPVMNNPTVTSQGSGRMRLVYNVQTEYGKFFIANYQQGSAANQRISSLMMTTAYNQGAGTATIDIPDFSGVAGFDANWLLKVGVSTTWTSTATGWPSAGGITSTPLTEGAVYQSGTRMGTVTP